MAEGFAVVPHLKQAVAAAAAVYDLAEAVGLTTAGCDALEPSAIAQGVSSAATETASIHQPGSTARRRRTERTGLEQGWEGLEYEGMSKTTKATRAATPNSVLKKMREICLSLPDTKETLTWGEPHFRVGEKIFSGCGNEKGRLAITFKLEMDHADAIIQAPRFWRAPYVGQHGWVSMDPTRVKDWGEVRALVLESYRLIAPKKTLARLTADTSVAPARTKTATRRPAAAGKKPPARESRSSVGRPRRGE